MSRSDVHLRSYWAVLLLYPLIGNRAARIGTTIPELGETREPKLIMWLTPG